MSDATAVVVGLCAHGLTICRSLHNAGIPVVAIEADEAQPGVRTNTARVVMVDDINDVGLIDALISLAPTLSGTNPPVLFVTNDKMVKTVGQHYDRLHQIYRVSWGPSQAELLPLLQKDHIRERSATTNLLHPASKLIRSRQDATGAALGLRFPLILKPDEPISAYKTLLIEDESALQRHWDVIKQSLPSIAQEFIPGDDSNIHFAALYLNEGEVLARFEGRKLRSRPMGHTTVAISQADDDMHDMACKFFRGLDISGPVSLEVKKDPSADLWVIEPTVGRSDFWVGLCIADGVDLPVIEYCHASQQHIDLGRQCNQTLWMNEQRDPAAFAWLLLRYPRYLLQMRIIGVFFSLRDPRPFFRWSADALRALPGRFLRKLSKTLRGSRKTRPLSEE
jgi:predicted ATP-grasp superfamily ATP-dependent carboligase